MKLTAKTQPPPFCIVVDSREKPEHRLPFPDGVPWRVGTLYPGDYSADGLQNVIAIEKKDLADLVGTLVGKSENADGSTIERKVKFAEELTAMRNHRFKCVVVTEPLRKLTDHLYQSSVPPANIVRMIQAMEYQTGVAFKFFDSPKQAAMFVAGELFEAYEIEHGLSSIKYTFRKLRPERITPRLPDAPKRKKTVDSV